MTAQPLDAAEFRQICGCFATGVVVVTASAPGRDPVGITANSFTSVSLDPPLILVSLAKTLRSLPDFQAAGHFAVNVLGAGHQDIALRFAQQGIDKWAGVMVGRGAGGAPLLRDAIAVFECERFAVHPAGDHELHLGRVIGMRGDCTAEPLIFHAGKLSSSEPMGSLPRS